MKKTLLILLLVITLFTMTGCTRGRKYALDFKEEYEAINGKTMRDDITYRTLTIDKKNPYIKVEPSEIVKKIENKESFYLYIGDPLCPWCRSGLEKMIEVAIKEGIKDIYYIDFWDDDHNEILRDLYEVQSDGKKNKLVQTREASEDYLKILEAVKNYAQDYTVTKDGKTYDVGEKRVFGGDHFSFANGICQKYVSLRSDKLEKSTDELTEEVLKDQETKFKAFFTKNTCDNDSNC